MTPTKTTQDKHEPDRDETIIHVMTTNPEVQHNVSISSKPPSSSRKLPMIVMAMLLLIVVIGVYSFSSNGKSSNGVASLVAATPAKISITSSGFVPATVTVKVGQAVTWTNTDTASHIVASDPYPTDNGLAGFDSKQDLTPNDQYSFVFNKVGAYTYHDDLNPYSFEGTVIVKQ